MITMLVGSTGAGKTTYGRKLAAQQPAVLYSIDNWMKELWGGDMPEDPQPDWFKENHQWYVERIARCEQKILELSIQRAKIEQKSILDLGFSTKIHRKKFVDTFQKEGVQCQIVWLNMSESVRWSQVQQRNKDRGETFVMTVDRSLFDYMESVFEPPDAFEGVKIEELNERSRI